MPLIVMKFKPQGGEKKVLNHLEKLYKKIDRDVFLLHDNLLSYDSGISFKPDFILLDPLYGISIIEVKSYDKKSIDKLENNKIYFRDGSIDTCPFKKAQEYAFKLGNYLRSHGFQLNTKDIKSNLVFTNLPKEYFKSYPFVTNHFKNFKETLTLSNMFPNTEMEPKFIEDIYQVMNPVTYFRFDDDKTLDEIKSNMAKLDETQLDFVKKPIAGHYLISGIPGSGKSIAVISRAIYIANEHPDWKVLILSENKKLKAKNEKALRERTKYIDRFGHNPDDNITCKTLYSFLSKLSPKKAPRYLNYPEQLDFMCDQIFENGIEELYDAVLIDEYQDFTDEQLIIAKNSAKKKDVKINNKSKTIENIFLAGDKLQKLKERGGSHNWLDMGFEVKGHSKNLKGSYRCGREILDLALSFLQSASKTMKKEVDTYYEGTDNIEYLSDFDGSISSFVGWYDVGASKLKSWVQGLLNKGVPANDIIIIGPNSKKKKKELLNIFSEEVEMGLEIGMPSNIKGLEASYCALYDFGSFGFFQNTTENKYKELYMCLTRSRVGLFIHCTSEDNEEFQKLKELMDLKGIEDSGFDEAA